jgi:hypothetical protein
MFSPEELIGRTFIREMEDGQKLRAEIKKELLLRDTENQCDIQKFLVTIGDGVIDELIGYNELSDLVERQMGEQIQADPETLHPYTRIVGHEGPLKSHDPTYKNSMWNVLVEWTDGTMTSEPMWIMKRDDPITLAAYGLEQGLLKAPGWKQLEHYTRREKKLKRMLKAPRQQSKRYGVKYKFGVRLPRNWKDATELDTANENSFMVRCDQD